MNKTFSLILLVCIIKFTHSDCPGVGVYTDIVAATFDNQLIIGKSILSGDNLNTMNLTGQLQNKLAAVKTYGKPLYSNTLHLQNSIIILTNVRSKKLSYYAKNENMKEKTVYRYVTKEDIKQVKVSNIFSIMSTDTLTDKGNNDYIYKGNIITVSQELSNIITHQLNKPGKKFFTHRSPAGYIFGDNYPEEETEYFDDRYDVFFVFGEDLTTIRSLKGKTISYKLISDLHEIGVYVLCAVENFCY